MGSPPGLKKAGGIMYVVPIPFARGEPTSQVIEKRGETKNKVIYKQSTNRCL
jgi:hypothetical protein